MNCTSTIVLLYVQAFEAQVEEDKFWISRWLLMFELYTRNTPSF